jgi:hypothetical protein
MAIIYGLLKLVRARERADGSRLLGVGLLYQIS